MTKSTRFWHWAGPKVERLARLVLWFLVPAVPLAVFVPPVFLACAALLGWFVDDLLLRCEWEPYPMFAAVWCANALAIQVLWGAL